VLLTNPGSHPITIERLELDVMADGQELYSRCYRGLGLDERLRRAQSDFQGIQGSIEKFVFGCPRPFESSAAIFEATIAPGQVCPILFEHFRLPSSIAPQALAVRCGTASGDIVHEIGITAPSPRNRYRFPLADTSFIMNALDNTYVLSHRRLQSQEFALDIMQLTPEFSLHSGSGLNGDYPSYGKPVLAASDGVVVISHATMPENAGDMSHMLAEEQVEQLYLEQGELASMLGNHVIIEHAHGEHTLYVHLKTDCVTVKRGDRVVAGQPIGRLGNSGFSGGPHLHFALMDGPDLVRAQGIPCVFDELVDVTLRRPIARPLECGWLVRGNGGS